jgi:hypothetical protein
VWRQSRSLWESFSTHAQALWLCGFNHPIPCSALFMLAYFVDRRCGPEYRLKNRKIDEPPHFKRGLAWRV